jgi:hypothetical protein
MVSLAIRKVPAGRDRNHKPLKYLSKPVSREIYTACQ